MDSTMEDSFSELCFYCGAKTSSLEEHKLKCKMITKNIKSSHNICVHCGKKFAHKSSLSRHETTCRQGSPSNFKCPVCFVVFKRADNYRRHCRGCNTEAAKVSNGATCKLCHMNFSNIEDYKGHTCITKKKPLLSNCLYEECKMTFYRRSQLVNHLRKVHGNRIQEERNMVFESMKAFLEWKMSEEEATFSCFTKRSGTRSNTDYYYCKLDGSSKPHCKTGQPARKTDRRLKKGPVKTDRICLAKMKVKIEADGSCNVLYQPTHSHKLNVMEDQPQIFLTDTVKYINEQLSMGISPKKCFKTIINGTLNTKESNVHQPKSGQPILVSGNNTHLLSKRIKVRNNKDDAISVMIQVAILSKERSNPVLLYKPLGEDKVIGTSKVDRLVNSLDLFVLGIQTKEQKAMMLQGDGLTLSISWVDDINAYGYRLLTFVVPDAHNRGFPVAYFILNQFNESTLLACLLCIKENCVDLNISCIIIPDNPLLIDALQKSFGDEIGYVFCLSNIFKTLQTFLEEMAPKELINEIYQQLCSLIECEDEFEVVRLLEIFVTSYSGLAPEFVDFFKENYLNRIEKWSMAHRKFPHCNLNTTVLNESIHNQIKAADTNDASTRRLDALINILLDIEEDYYKNKNVEEIIGIPYALGDVTVQHADSAAIPDESIMQQHNNAWEILAEPNSDKVYEIIKCSDCCTKDVCFFTCNSFECNCLCSHLYLCSCEDKNPLCSHIHKLQTLFYRGIVEDTKCTDSSDEEPEVCTSVKNEVAPTFSAKIDTIKMQLKQLSEFVKNGEAELGLLERIESGLERLLSGCRGEAPDTFNKSQESNIKHEKHNALLNCIIKDDLGRYEFEYIQQTTEDTQVNDLIAKANSHSTNIPLSMNVITRTFTPSVSYSNLNQIVIKTGTEELSLLHLKCLDPYLSDQEINYLRHSSRFREQYMYSKIINSFLINLQLSFNQIFPLSSDIALTLYKSGKAKTFFSRELVEKDVLIMPMNLSQKYWSCIAVYVKEKEIIYFSPFGKIGKRDSVTITNFLHNLQEDTEWNIMLPNYGGELEDDKMAYGAHVCHFAAEIARKTDLTVLKDINSYRKQIYDSIVGGCLRRDVYDNLICGKCNSYDCPQSENDLGDLSLCCRKCNQWYHNLCVGILEIDVCHTDFTCPL